MEPIMYPGQNGSTMGGMFYHQIAPSGEMGGPEMPFIAGPGIMGPMGMGARVEPSSPRPRRHPVHSIAGDCASSAQAG